MIRKPLLNRLFTSFWKSPFYLKYASDSSVMMSIIGFLMYFVELDH